MAISNELYSKLPNLVLGFHGCTKTTYEKVLNQLEALKPSDNSYDWLGHGTYMILLEEFLLRVKLYIPVRRLLKKRIFRFVLLIRTV